MVGETLRNLLMIAWLLPLLGFAVEIFGGFWGTRKSRTAAWLAVGCIVTGFICSASALCIWGKAGGWDAMKPVAHDAHGGHGESAHPEQGDSHHGETHGEEGHHSQVVVPVSSDFQLASVVTSEEHPEAEASSDEPGSDHGSNVYSGKLYSLGTFGGLEVSLDYYIDSLTLVMFTMVTLIASCIHLFAMGYMSEELTDEYVDHHAHTADGHHVHRPGRFYRFFAFLSLFCFSMLGLVLAGNIFQVFIFWELVGICSFLLIGFYTERKSASNAANKAFIMNRVGDFGFLIGLMVIWTWFGTFRFAESTAVDGSVQPGLFQMLPRGEDGDVIRVPATGEVVIGQVPTDVTADGATAPRTIPYYLLVVAGLGVFAGCIGKSAQFPLQTWLPDAMEGPTPVSALVHSATMVAAGVYLVGRFFPMFVQEVLLTIAYVGCITLFLAATIAIVATDIKKVLAYSTISQLGYMMLGLGVFGWAAGLFHLITHAFFKSLMFLCSGSVIYGCHHEQEMPKMGGLWRKMPITAFTMLVGVIAIAGLAIPYVAAFSGYHSKDAIVATALAYTQSNPAHFLLFVVPLVTAGITAFYMFRLWFYTFAGKPRDKHIYDHCHESPLIMTAPLLILSVFAAFCATKFYQVHDGPLYRLLTVSQPAHVDHGVPASAATSLAMPSMHAIHEVHNQAGLLALLAAVTGTLLAWLLYGTSLVNVGEIKRHLAGVHGFLENKWHFDDLYDALFMKPAHVVGKFCAWFDRTVFDGILHGAARTTVLVSKWDRVFDENVVDGLVNLVGRVTFSVGASLKAVQTGRLRQYVMFIVVGVVVLFVALFVTFPR
ncbi:MAG: NADH-quinone oxidoreductase subunit L [Planctomycetaceae bacterium]|nr:NADH-quinone oxidoreductase subunit L [Planctomycetaceae bacterium]